jgi:co-chaperonin GroES (HSP10)
MVTTAFQNINYNKKRIKMTAIPENDILIVTKKAKEEVTASGLYIGVQRDNDPVWQCDVLYANPLYGYVVGDKLLIPFNKLLESKVLGDVVYFVKVTDILATV